MQRRSEVGNYAYERVEKRGKNDCRHILLVGVCSITIKENNVRMLTIRTLEKKRVGLPSGHSNWEQSQLDTVGHVNETSSGNTLEIMEYKPLS